jgi:ATP-binding cassette subfamily B protein
VSVRQGRRGSFLTEEEKANSPKITKSLLKRIASYLKPFIKQLSLIVLIIGISSSLKILPSLLTGKIIDDGLIKRDLDTLIFLIGLSVGVTLLGNLIGLVESYLNTWVSENITFNMRNQMYRKLQSMSHRFFTTNNQGDIITRMTSDISGVKQVISGTFTSILSNVITLIVASVAMFQKNWILALVGLVIVPLFAIPTRSAGKTRWTLTNEVQKTSDEINGILNETLSVSGQLLVKLFNRHDYEINKYEKTNKKMISLHLKQSLAGRWFRVLISTFSSIGPMLIYLVGGILMMQVDSTLTVGDITVLVTLLSRMYQPVNSLLNTQVEVIRSMALFSRIFGYLDMQVEVENKIDAIVPKSFSGNIRFENVSFAYDESRNILDNVTFELKSGKSVAIVGPSGAGKSTIINLILRLYDTTSGSILFEENNVRDLDLKFIRDHIGLVTQDTYLFNSTILDNLLYANSKATMEMIVDACKKANIHDFIESLPEKYNSVVGNRGLKLSGGEKQRLSIARVLLKDPTVVIFDEATSSLDSIAENLIQEAIAPMIQEKTSIVIAHRLSTILAADEILVIEKGRIVERGQHLELLQKDGLYTQLYETQFKTSEKVD